ncbi:tripartite tricarboxylate transporter substrate binding protein, partial [Enterococcus sp. HPCN18]
MTPSLRFRRNAALLSAALSLFVHAAPATAEEWPTKPVTMIMGFPAGSGVDVVARAIQEPLSKQ